MTDETFTRTAPPLTRYTVKLGATGPAPWDVLTAQRARDIADVIWRNAEDTWWLDEDDAVALRAYADAVDAMTKPPTLDLSVEALNG